VELNMLLKTPEWQNEDLSHLRQQIDIPIPDFVPYPSGKRVRMEKRESERNGNDCSENDETEKTISLGGAISANEKIVYLIKIVKPKIQQLLEDSNILKMWISYMIPKIEDGNNFGVSVQEETLAEVEGVESEAAVFLDHTSRYYEARGKLITKVAKYPHVEDYRYAVSELDEKQFVSLWMLLREIRNHYSALHDIVLKNLDKIKQPRTCNTDSLY